jgi:hypothetical protein
MLKGTIPKEYWAQDIIICACLPSVTTFEEVDRF